MTCMRKPYGVCHVDYITITLAVVVLMIHIYMCTSVPHILLTILLLEVRFSAEEACSVLATEVLGVSLRLGVELLLRLVNTLV